MNIQCDYLIEARRPDMIVVNKGERKCVILDIAVPGHSRVSNKKKRENREVRNIRKVIVVPLIVGALESITKKLDECLEK